MKMLGFEKDDLDLPPSYDLTIQQTLSASSHGVQLSIPTPVSGRFLPGGIVRGTLSIPNDVLGSVEGDIGCQLEGKSSVEVMGKSRYQKAQLVSASFGSNPMPITAREDHLFALQSISLPKPESFGGDADVSLELLIPGSRTCDCISSSSSEGLGLGDGDGILPSLGWRGSFGERNRVRWKIKVVIARKGLMKRDIKLSIEIPVSLPSPPSSKSPLVASQSKALIYKSSDTSGSAPELETTLTIYPSSPSTPRLIPFRITLTSPMLPTTPSSSSKATPGADDLDGLKVSLGLCKHTWTKGIHTSVGSDKGHEYPGIMVGNLVLDDKRPDAGRGVIQVKELGSGGMIVEGEFQNEEDELTAQGCGLRLNWSLQVQVRWRKLDSPLVVSQPIYLPHHSNI